MIGRALLLLLVAAGLAGVFSIATPRAVAAVFPSGASDNARLEVTDTTGGLSMPGSNALTVACWVKLSIPSNVTISQNMTILGNRRTGDWNQPHAYRFYFNASTGSIEFSARGSSALTPIVLIQRPSLDRWYHLAVTRAGDVFTPWLDGRQLPSVTQAIGSSATTDGVSIGGFLTAERFWGEIQEVAIYQQAITSRSVMVNNMFSDINPASFPNLKGYFKLGYSTTLTDNLKNFAATPPTGTASAAQQGNGTIEFPATDKNGEQSLFDSRKNEGRDATSSLAGSFGWEHDVFQRSTPGVPFEFSFAYSSSIAFSGQPLEDGVDVYAEDSVLSAGWRHSFQTRLVPGSRFLNGNGTYVGLLLWNGGLETWKRLSGGVFTPLHAEYRGEMKEVSGGDYVEWTTPDRLVLKFHHPTNSIEPLLPGRLIEVRDFNGNHIVLNYDLATGRLTSVNDSGGGVWTFTHNAQDLLATVSGPSTNVSEQWTATFTYDGSNRLVSKAISGPAAHAPVASTTWQFEYNTFSGRTLLNRVRDPKGYADLTLNYDTYGRKSSETDAVGRITTFQYNVPGLRQLTTTAQAGGSPNAANDRSAVETFDRKLHLLSQLSPLGFTTSYEYDATGNVTATIDARGLRSSMTYDTRSNILTRTNGLGETTTWLYAHVLTGGTLLNKPTKETRPVTSEAPTGWENRYEYDGAGNLRFHRDGPVVGADFGTLAEHTYDARGLVTASKDARGNESRFTYNATTGFLTSRTIAFGTTEAATWEVTARTELGWPVTEVNPLSESTTLGYNINGQVVSTTDAIGRIFTKGYDANGNLTTESDGKGINTTYGYNQADERITRTDRAGKLWDFRYNEFGELRETEGPPALSDGTTRRDIFSRIYDKNGRLREERDPYYDAGTPALHRIAYEYDESGNQTAVVNKLGQRWEKSYDALNRVFAERDPLGSVRRTAYDAAGRVLVVTAPEGHQSTHAYDGRGRLARWTDPEGFAWEYLYDGVGNIEKIIDAEHGEYVMTYGPRNERLTERNQDLKTWTYTYDKLVRLKTQANPPGAGAGPGGGPVLRTLYYDPVGRLDYVEFNTGRINDLGYDDNNNVRSIVRTQPGKPPTSLALDYDGLDRLAEVRDTFSKTVRYEYDALSRVNKKRYPGGKDLIQEYDRLGRLKKLSFPNVAGGTHDCTFAYDDADRLTGRTYPNGITQANTFDTAGRVETLGYAGTASPPIALGYAYDRNGNKTGGTENGTLAWKKSSLADYNDTSRFKADGKLIDRTDAAAAGGPRTFGYTYDASGNMTLATAPGESYALAYDEDNRTTSITWDLGMADKVITNRYDGLGRRVSRLSSETGETRYVLDLIGDMERILCDTDATGSILGWYVHGPDLCFRVSAAGLLTCYHADAMGNIIRTTNATGAAVNQYAYTPYGRKIDTTPSAITDPTDPYRFVGSQGVMLEFPQIASSSLYFMRARYYSAEAAVLFSTDPIKNIGPGWMPLLYGYASGNPQRFIDADGNQATDAEITKALAFGILWVAERVVLSTPLFLASYIDNMSGFVSGTVSQEEFDENNMELLPKAVGKLVGIGMKDAPFLEKTIGTKGAEFSVRTATGGKASDLRLGAPTISTIKHTYSAIGNIALTFENSVRGTPSSNISPQRTSKSTAQVVAANGAQSTKAASPSSGGGSSSTYTVKSGDTLGNIASKNGTTATALGTANGIKNLNLIKPGQKLTIPKAAAKPTAKKK